MERCSPIRYCVKASYLHALLTFLQIGNEHIRLRSQRHKTCRQWHVMPAEACTRMGEKNNRDNIT
jgi:hypothetical protein